MHKFVSFLFNNNEPKNYTNVVSNEIEILNTLILCYELLRKTLLEGKRQMYSFLLWWHNKNKEINIDNTQSYREVLLHYGFDTMH